MANGNVACFTKEGEQVPREQLGNVFAHRVRSMFRRGVLSKRCRIYTPNRGLESDWIELRDILEW